MTCVPGSQVLDTGSRAPRGWRRTHPLTLLAVAVALSAALSVVALIRPATPAQAAPCQGSNPARTAGRPAKPTPTRTAPPTTAPPSATAGPTSPSATSTSAAASPATNGQPAAPTSPPAARAGAAAPSPAATAPTPVPAPKPTGTPTKRPRPVGCPSGNPTPSPKLLPAAPDQPYVNPTQSVLTAASLTVTYLGVVDLPTRAGTIRVMKFALADTTSTVFELRVPAQSRTLSIKGGKLTVSGTAEMYATKIVGTVDGSTVTYTPDSPPAVPTPLSVGDATVDLAYLHSDALNATGLSVGNVS